jgi:hypothetical protein
VSENASGRALAGVRKNARLPYGLWRGALAGLAKRFGNLCR